MSQDNERLCNIKTSLLCISTTILVLNCDDFDSDCCKTTDCCKMILALTYESTLNVVRLSCSDCCKTFLALISSEQWTPKELSATLGMLLL